jgi:hypothetical protein
MKALAFALFVTVTVTALAAFVADSFIGTQHDREGTSVERVAKVKMITRGDRSAAAALWNEIYTKTLDKTGYVSTSRDAANDAVSHAYGTAQ